MYSPGNRFPFSDWMVDLVIIDVIYTIVIVRFCCSKNSLLLTEAYTQNCRVRIHEKNSGDAVRRLGTIIQTNFCAQSWASIRHSVWKWSVEIRYPGALPPVLEYFRRVFSPGRSTDCPWVSEDAIASTSTSIIICQLLLWPQLHLWLMKYSSITC